MGGALLWRFAVVGTFALLTSACAAYWSFDDQSNPTEDEFFGDHDGTVVGATFETNDIAPVAGNTAALGFDGDDYVEVPDPDGSRNLDGFMGLTLAAWIKPTTVSVTNGCNCQIIVSKYHSAAPFNTIS